MIYKELPDDCYECPTCGETTNARNHCPPKDKDEKPDRELDNEFEYE